MDDGQVFCRPEHVDRVLRRLDEGMNAIGASRGTRTAGDDIKSTVRVFGNAENSDDWVTDYVKDTCKIQTPSSECKVLGGALGPAAQHAAVYVAAVSKTAGIHEAINNMLNARTSAEFRIYCDSQGMHWKHRT